MEIEILHRQGISNRQIAKTLAISRNTVKKYLGSSSNLKYSRQSNRATKLKSYENYLKARVEAALPDWIPATVLLLEIQAKGYMGKLTQLRNYLRQLKPKLNRLCVLKQSPGSKCRLTGENLKWAY